MTISLKKPLNATTIEKENKSAGQQQLLWLLLLSGAYLLRDIIGLPMPDIIFTGLCGMAFLFLDTGSSMGIYIFTTVLTVPDFEIRLVYLAVLLAKFWIQGKKLRGSMLLIFLGMALLEFVNLSIFSNQTFFTLLYSAIFRLSYFVLPLFWLSEEYSAKDYRRALLCYMFGVVLGGSVLLYMSVQAVGWQTLLNDPGIRLGLNTTDGYVTQSEIQTGYNANQLGGMFVIVTTIILALTDGKYIRKIWGVLLLPLSFFMVLLTKSREAILLLIATMIYYCLFLVLRKKKLLLGLLFFLTIVALAYAMVEWLPNVIDSLLSRFQDKDNLTGARGELFVLYMSAWKQNIWVFLFGYGIGSYREVVDIFNVPHNIIADIAIGWGFTGLLVISFCLVLLYKQSVRDVGKNTRLIACLPALVALVATFAGQYLSTAYPHMRLCFLILAIKAFSDVQQKELPSQQTTGETL